MGGRYIISGSQIGTLIALLKQEHYPGVTELLNTVYDKQFIGDSKHTLEGDIEKLRQSMKDRSM